MVGSSAETIGLLIVGCVLLVAAALNECFTSRSPIIPPRLFKVACFCVVLRALVDVTSVDADYRDNLSDSAAAGNGLLFGHILFVCVFPSVRFLCYNGRNTVSINVCVLVP